MPRAAGILLFARSTGRVLFLQNTDGVWETPGGKIERGESPQLAALREFREEVGRSLHVLGCATTRAGYVLFDATTARQFTPVLSHEHVDFTWACPEDPPRPLHPGLKTIFRENVRANPFAATQYPAGWKGRTGGVTFGDYALEAYAKPGANEWDVDAYLLRNWLHVGEAQFAGVYDDERNLVALKGWQVTVRPEHRRRGLASAMYRYAEQAFGLPIRRGSFQTPAGRAFLEHR